MEEKDDGLRECAAFLFLRAVEGKRKGSGEGAGGAREKLLGPYVVFSRPSCIAFQFVFKATAANFLEFKKNKIHITPRN